VAHRFLADVIGTFPTLSQGSMNQRDKFLRQIRLADHTHQVAASVWPVFGKVAGRETNSDVWVKFQEASEYGIQPRTRKVQIDNNQVDTLDPCRKTSITWVPPSDVRHNFPSKKALLRWQW
jgi:hypothetical protein